MTTGHALARIAKLEHDNGMHLEWPGYPGGFDCDKAAIAKAEAEAADERRQRMSWVVSATVFALFAVGLAVLLSV